MAVLIALEEPPFQVGIAPRHYHQNRGPAPAALAQVRGNPTSIRTSYGPETPFPKSLTLQLGAGLKYRALWRRGPLRQKLCSGLLEPIGPWGQESQLTLAPTGSHPRRATRGSD